MPSPKELGARIRAEREHQRYSVQSAAKAAVVSRDTWRKIEAGESVQDTKRRAALELLGLDDDGRPVGGDPQDASYVASPGERVEGGSRDDEVLREIRAVREQQERMSERLARVEERLADS